MREDSDVCEVVCTVILHLPLWFFFCLFSKIINISRHYTWAVSVSTNTDTATDEVVVYLNST